MPYLYPDEAYGLFDIQEVYVTVPVGGPVPLVSADSMRVAIFFAINTGAGNVRLSTNGAVAVNQGFLLGTGPQEFTNVKHGALPGQAWYASNFGGGGSATVTVLTVRLARHADWPAAKQAAAPPHVN